MLLQTPVVNVIAERERWNAGESERGKGTRGGRDRRGYLHPVHAVEGVGGRGGEVRGGERRGGEGERVPCPPPLLPTDGTRLGGVWKEGGREED